MTSYYEDQPSVEYPSLFLEVSQGLKFMVDRYKIDHTKAELCILREQVLGMLDRIGINRETYDANRHCFIEIEAEFIVLNNFYNTSHSFADMNSPKYKYLTT